MKRKDVWVSAEAPQPTAPAPATRPAPTPDSVSAQWRDNLGMGIGVFCVLVSGFFIAQIVSGKFGLWRNFWTDIDTTATWIAFSFLAGVQAYGWLMAWRSSIDEIERQNTINILRSNETAMLEDINALVAKRDEYEQKYENAIVSLAEARAALHQAMGRNSDRYRAPEDDPVAPSVERDAQFLLQLMHSKQPAGWQSVTKTYKDWNRDKWEAARDLLEAAGAVRTVGNQTKLSELTYQASVGKLGAYCHSEWDS